MYSVHVRWRILTVRRSYASAVLGVVILSVCPSVCHTRVLRQTKQCTVDILTPHERAITLVFWHQQWLVGDAPFHLQFALKVTHPFEKCGLRHIFAYNVSTVRDSDKSSIMTNRKSTDFPTSYRWSEYVTLKSPKDGSKSNFWCLKNKIQFQSNYICYKVSLCENVQQHNCSITIPRCNGPQILARNIT